MVGAPAFALATWRVFGHYTNSLPMLAQRSTANHFASLYCCRFLASIRPAYRQGFGFVVPCFGLQHISVGGFEDA